MAIDSLRQLDDLAETRPRLAETGPVNDDSDPWRAQHGVSGRSAALILPDDGPVRRHATRPIDGHRATLWTPTSVAFSLLGTTLGPTLAGVLLGCLLGAAGIRATGTFLYEVAVTDALPSLTGSVLVLVAAVGAGLPSALRVARVDPSTLLRTP